MAYKPGQGDDPPKERDRKVSTREATSPSRGETHAGHYKGTEPCWPRGK